MDGKKTPKCFKCGAEFEDWKKLALHITKKGTCQQRRSMFAARVLAARTLRPKIQRVPKDPDKISNPEMLEWFEEYAKGFQLSGSTEAVVLYCPVCRNKHRAIIPVEVNQRQYFWRTSGYPTIICATCRSANEKRRIQEQN